MYVLVGDGIVFAVIDVPGYMNEDEYVWNGDGKGLVRDVWGIWEYGWLRIRDDEDAE